MNALSAIGVFLQGVGTVLGAIAVIVAGILGASSLKKWRAQKIADRKFDQAERIIVAAYNVRRDLAYLRNPFISARELADAERQLIDSDLGLTEDPDRRKPFITQQAYFSRLNAAFENRKQLLDCQPMARALFGERLEGALETLGQQFGVVQASLEFLPSLSSGSDDPEFRKQIYRTITRGHQSAENEVDRTIADQIKTVEDICLPILRLGGTEEN